MATATRVSVDHYLRSTYEPDAEYVDGEIEKRPMGEDDRSAWQKLFADGSTCMQKSGMCAFGRSCAFWKRPLVSVFPM